MSLGMTTEVMIWKIILPGLGTTLIIMILAFLFSALFGFLLALALVCTYPKGLKPMPKVYFILDGIINVIRSVPFIILIVTLMPVSRLLFGSAIGLPAATFAITVHASCMVARLLEGSFRETNPDLIEAARSFGAPRWRILWTVVVGETVPSMVTNLTYVMVSILSCTAVAGAVGAGGIGFLALTYGYQNFNDFIMYTCLAILVVFTILLQFIGNRIYLKVK